MEHCKLIIIAAVSVDGVIGIDDQIPWRIPEDFRHFRETTMGHMLLVGYNTYKTLPPKAFEGREYMVLNSSAPIEFRPETYQFRHLDTILGTLNSSNNDVDKVFVAGGAMVYDTLIDYCDECIITWVNINLPNGNKRFPIDKLFANFVAYRENGWHNSKNNFLYKITYYRKKDIPLNEK
jgi:dihydrofolate reductase